MKKKYTNRKGFRASAYFSNVMKNKQTNRKGLTVSAYLSFVVYTKKQEKPSQLSRAINEEGK